jgi:predicted phage tail protein
MNRLILHGHLKDSFSEEYTMEVNSPKEAVRALCFQIKGFKDSLAEGEYALIRGDVDTGVFIGLEDLDISLGTKDLHIVPVVSGGGGDSGGIIKTIVGIVLIAVSIVTFQAWGVAGAQALLAAGGLEAAAVLTTYAAATLGVSMALSGISSILAPSPKGLNANDKDTEQTSFVFNGAINVNQQGHPIPIVVGRIRTGSVVVAASIENEQIRVNRRSPNPFFSGGFSNDRDYGGPYSGGARYATY